MPKLKHIKCSIELPPTNEPLSEFHPIYSDGVVETFVAIPYERSAFNIHVTSEGYIARGLAVFVFIDGVYQCMRFRGDLEEEDPPYLAREETEVDFRFRQKEEKIRGERFLGREWRFDKLNIAATDDEAHRSDEIGTIEVVVLRLHGMEAPPEVRAMYGGYDGAYDDGDEDNFDAAFDGPSDHRERERTPKTRPSLVADPGSLAGTSTASPATRVRPLIPGDGYYDLYRPHARRSSLAHGFADLAARRRYRPSADFQDGIQWARSRMDRGFTVAAETAKDSDSPRASLVSEANRRPEEGCQRGCNSGAHAGRERHVNFQDGFPQNPFAYAAEPWASGRNQSHGRENGKPLWRRDQPDSELASTVTFRGHERPSFLDSKHRFDPRYANDTQHSHREKPVVEEQSAWPDAWDGNGDTKSQKIKSSKTNKDGGNVDISAWDNVGNNGNVDTNGSDNDKSSKKDDQAWPAVEPSVKDHGSHKTKSHKSARAPSSVSYMHVPSIPEEPAFKSYWKDWNKRPTEQKSRLAKYVESASSKDFVLAPTEVPEQVPESEAKKRGLKHQVYAGKGVDYRHRLGVPVYKDTMEQPYAVFRFRYRTRETLEKMLRGKDVAWDKVKKREKQQKLMGLSKEELVEQLMKSKVSGKSGSTKPSVKAASNAGLFVKTWVEEQAKVPSESMSKPKSSPEPITCDRCNREMEADHNWWHCEPCDQDICFPCNKDGKEWCNNKTHQLERWGHRLGPDGKVGGNADWLQPKKSRHGGSERSKPSRNHSSSQRSNGGGSQKGWEGQNAARADQNATSGAWAAFEAPDTAGNNGQW